MLKVFLSPIFMAFSTIADPLVVIPDGQIQGKTYTTSKNEEFYGFHRIPYAKAPLRSLRFQAPKPAKPWTGVLDGTKEGSCCHRVRTDGINENEDCLFINVFTPIANATKNDTLLPVMFWIYGGAIIRCLPFLISSGPDYFMEQGIVVVMPNYRVGPFGFLSTGDAVIPGNAGLKDQALALKWTYNNIKYFGGDPKKIVIFGESEGSGLVGYQLLNKNNYGIISGAIQESGSPLNNWIFMKNPKDYAVDIVTKINASQNMQDSFEIRQFLQSVPAYAIIAAARMRKDNLQACPLPVIEVDHPDALITKYPYELFETGDFVKVPLIIGINSEEDLFLLKSTKYIREWGENLDRNVRDNLIPQYFNLKANKSKMELEEDIKAIYLNESQTFADELGATVRFHSDDSFTRGIIKQGLLMSNFTDVYFYVFSYKGEMGGWNKSIEGAEKVSHREELRYMWIHRGNNSNEDLRKYSQSDVITHTRLIKMWTDFAKTLNPTPEKSELINVIWEKFDENYRYLDIGADLTIKTNPKASFPKWEEIYKNYADKPYVIY